MEARQLRIGNLISFMGNVDKVNSLAGIEKSYISTLSSGIFHESNFKPIPLTEEWLVKFGFDKDFNGFYKLFKHSEVPILIKDGFWTCDGISFSVNCLYHVHQLQNLYFALTGEELTIKK